MQVKGNLLVKGKFTTTADVIGKITTVTGAYAVLPTDETVVCNNASPFTVTLPAAVVGQFFTIKNIGAGKVTVDGAGSDTIDGNLTQGVRKDESLSIQCYVANAWAII